jgi:hypothetical protein
VPAPSLSSSDVSELNELQLAILGLSNGTERLFRQRTRLLVMNEKLFLLPIQY